MSETVKIECLDQYGCPTGTVHILTPVQAAQKIAAMGLKIGGFPEALGEPFDVAYPWRINLYDGREAVAFLDGGYKDLRMIQAAMDSPKYETTPNSCTCKGFHFRKHCKHVDGLREKIMAVA